MLLTLTKESVRAAGLKPEDEKLLLNLLEKYSEMEQVDILFMVEKMPNFWNSFLLRLKTTLYELSIEDSNLIDENIKKHLNLNK